MNIVINEEIAPEVARAIIAQATIRGLSVNDYLRQLLGLRVANTVGPPRNEGMLHSNHRSR